MPAPARPFRFLGHVGDGDLDARRLSQTARRAEAVGYSMLVIPDHLVNLHAPVPLLATAAAVTERIRIGTFVFNVDLRHPAVLAQEIASLDVLSGGRFEIGIGAGWNKPEYDAIGLRFDPVGTRVSRLAEAITVLKGCLGDGPFSFAGAHYRIDNYNGLPKPLQRPHPPLFVGGGGRRLLTLAGREADIVGVAPRVRVGGEGPLAPDAPSITAAATEEKIGWIRAAAGDRFDQLELNTYPSGGPVVVTNRARAVAQERADELYRRTGVTLTVDELLDSPHTFIGSVSELTEKILGLRERFGISSIMFQEIEELAPVVENLAGR